MEIEENLAFTVYIPEHYLSTTKQGVYNEERQVQIYIQNAKKGKNLGGLAIENEVLYSALSTK